MGHHRITTMQRLEHINVVVVVVCCGVCSNGGVDQRYLRRQQRLEKISNGCERSDFNPYLAQLSHDVPIVPFAPCTHVSELLDFDTNPYLGGTEAGGIFLQVSSGNDPDIINISWAPDPDLLPQPWVPDRQRKYKTRRVFHGDSVITEDSDTALLWELSEDSNTALLREPSGDPAI